MPIEGSLPPRAAGGLPVLGHLLPFLRNPTACLATLRAKHGDTFLVDLIGFRLLFVFGPIGLRSLYGLAEEDASFGEATRTLLGLKLPPELQAGDLTVFQHLFNRERMESYLGHVNAAVDDALAELGDGGTFEAFAHMKRLVHRIGFRCWAGREAASPPYLDQLIACFERFDPEEVFVRPSALFVTILTRKAPERRALRRAAAILDEIWAARERSGAREGDMLEQLHTLFAADPPAARAERVAKNVMILHLASLANLYASLAWTLVNLLQFPEHRAAVEGEAAAIGGGNPNGLVRDQRALAELVLLESCAMESIRLAQRSLTLRKVMRPCSVETDLGAFALEPGAYVATLLSVSNAAYDTLGRFDPRHYERGRLADHVRVPAKEAVSTFGHGRHACVGERFAMSAIKIAIVRYLDALDLQPGFARAAAPTGQMGAVARSAAPCPVRYARKRS
ncbi:MAG TPA: cytochrome P450 [Candidatus Eisenbacteria bacterium]|nr:cytochrome P450 [Candidatus Eisenbacteria bacterium]